MGETKRACADVGGMVEGHCRRHLRISPRFLIISFGLN